MTNLEPYTEVSKYLAKTRDLSVVVEDPDMEIIGDKIRQALGSDVNLIQSIDLISSSTYNELPSHVVERIGMRQTDNNLLMRVTIQSLDYEITNERGNQIYSTIYDALHTGDRGYYLKK